MDWRAKNVGDLWGAVIVLIVFFIGLAMFDRGPYSGGP